MDVGQGGAVAPKEKKKKNTTELLCFASSCAEYKWVRLQARAITAWAVLTIQQTRQKNLVTVVSSFIWRNRVVDEF
jgi:hypothetical protein